MDIWELMKSIGVYDEYIGDNGKYGRNMKKIWEKNEIWEYMKEI